MQNNRGEALGWWRVPRLWPGREVFILGGGPSVKLVDVEKLRDRRVIAVNNSYKLANWFDAMFFGDPRWLKHHGAGLVDFAGLKVTTAENHLRKPGLKVVRRRNSPTGLSRDPGMLVWNKSSGACAINLAVHLGASRIVLVGFDMRRVEGRTHWHDDYGARGGRDPYHRFLAPFPEIARDLKNLGIECLNASPGSALEEFPIVDPREVLE